MKRKLILWLSLWLLFVQVSSCKETITQKECTIDNKPVIKISTDTEDQVKGMHQDELNQEPITDLSDESGLYKQRRTTSEKKENKESKEDSEEVNGGYSEAEEENGWSEEEEEDGWSEEEEDGWSKIKSPPTYGIFAYDERVVHKADFRDIIRSFTAYKGIPLYVTKIILDYVSPPPFGISTYSIDGYAPQIRALGKSYDNRFLFAGGSEEIGGSCIKIWDVQKNEFIRTIWSPMESITNLVVSPCDNKLMTQSKDGTLQKFQLKKTSQTKWFELECFYDHTEWLHVPSDIKKCTISKDGQYRCLQYASGRIIVSRIMDGLQVYEFTANGEITFWEVTNKNQLIVIDESQITVRDFQADGTDQSIMSKIQYKKSCNNGDYWACLTTDENFLIFGSAVSISIYEMPSLKSCASFKMKHKYAKVLSHAEYNHVFAVGSTEENGTIEVYSFSPSFKQWQKDYEINNERATALCFISNGDLLVSASQHHIKIWDTKTGKLFLTKK